MLRFWQGDGKESPAVLVACGDASFVSFNDIFGDMEAYSHPLVFFGADKGIEDFGQHLFIDPAGIIGQGDDDRTGGVPDPDLDTAFVKTF